MRISSPIPEQHLAEAAEIWWNSFGLSRRRKHVQQIRPGHGVAAIDRDGRVAGVMGLRDDRGGFVVTPPRLVRWFYRAGPPTADLVIDGIVTLSRRQGTGRALLDAALARARATGRPGVQAEVLARNTDARAFYDALGFVEVARGRYGWPWSGPVIVLRRAT